MEHGTVVAIDVVAVVVMACGIYFPRHRRRDLVFAYVALNVGVACVTLALSSASTAAGAGLGLGLFGLLSIIRLRSSELTQAEVAYYFVALAMGLLGGFEVDHSWISIALIGLLLAAVFVADHPRLFRGYRHQVLTLDAAHTDEARLHAVLEELLHADVMRMVVERVDLVRDTTVVDVRYRLRTRTDRPQADAAVASRAAALAGAGR